MTVIGYARVSSRELQRGWQERDLTAAGATRVFVDHDDSSRAGDRPQWSACLERLRDGDTVVVWALDRLAGTASMAIETIADLHQRGVNIRSVTEPDIDTTTTTGHALFGIVAVLAQLPGHTHRGNTRRGLEHALAQGHHRGGNPTVMTPERVTAAVQLRDAGSSISATARVLGVSASSVSRALARFDGPVRSSRP